MEEASTENINRAYTEAWAGVDRLVRKHGRDKVYFIMLQKGRIFRKNVPRTTWAFNYAVADIAPRSKKNIEMLIRSFREQASIRTLESIDGQLAHYDHVLGYWV